MGILSLSETLFAAQYDRVCYIRHRLLLQLDLIQALIATTRVKNHLGLRKETSCLGHKHGYGSVLTSESSVLSTGKKNKNIPVALLGEGFRAGIPLAI